MKNCVNSMAMTMRALRPAPSDPTSTTFGSDINYIRSRAAESGVEVEAIDDGSGYYYRYSEPDFSIFNRGLAENDLAQLKETILMLQRFKGMPNFDWMSELVVKLEDKLDLRGVSKSVVGYDMMRTTHIQASTGFRSCLTLSLTRLSFISSTRRSRM